MSMPTEIMTLATSDEQLEMIDLLFRRLGANYGAAWDRSIGQAPIADVKTVWADKLSGFLQTRKSMKAIKWALDNLPDHAPNAPTFFSLCRMAPAEVVLALPEPEVDPAKVAAELAKVRHSLAPLFDAPKNPEKGWAVRLQGRHEAGEKLNPNQIRCFQAALGLA